jgi:hypothetical protein
MKKFNELLTEIITDPINGPFDGEDYYLDENGIIQVPVDDIKLAAIIMRKVNNSGVFDKKLVRIGQGGDNVWLGFDTLLEAEPVYTQRIGPNKDVLAEVKKDTAGKFCLYLNGQRSTRLFRKLVTVKTFLKALDNELKNTAKLPEVELDNE